MKRVSGPGRIGLWRGNLALISAEDFTTHLYDSSGGEYTVLSGGPLIHLLFAFVASMAIGHSATKIHQQQCGSEKNCRINVLTSKLPLNANCTGRLFGELNCEMEFKANAEASNFTILCKDSDLVPHLDATVPVESYSYRVTKVTRSEGNEKFKLDPKLFFSFEHPAFKANLFRLRDVLTGEMLLLLNKTEHKMDNVSCLSSESVPSSIGPAQNANQF